MSHYPLCLHHLHRKIHLNLSPFANSLPLSSLTPFSSVPITLIHFAFPLLIFTLRQGWICDEENKTNVRLTLSILLLFPYISLTIFFRFPVPMVRLRGRWIRWYGLKHFYKEKRAANVNRCKKLQSQRKPGDTNKWHTAGRPMSRKAAPEPLFQGCYAIDQLPKSLAEIALHLRRGLSYDAHLLACSFVFRG